MAANVPAKLKPADIGRFALRAAQIEKAKPVIAYWCDYWIVNQIIEKGLHTADEECLQYTTNLMDKLEQFKNQNSENDAVTDNVAGQAYVEQFGLEVFNRAEATMRANKVTRQTADTFQAAATFLELSQIWGQLDPEIAAKIKFAKYHALRIAKAIKAGEDPNLTNPPPEEEREDEELEHLDPSDPDVKALQGSGVPPDRKPRQPSIEEIPDEADRTEKRLAQQSSVDESLHPSRASSVPPPPSVSRPNIPSKTTDLNTAHIANPVPLSDTAAPDLPSAPTDFAPSSILNLPDTPATSNLGAPPSSTHTDTFESFPPPTSEPPGARNLPQPPSAFYREPSPTFQPPVTPATLPSRNIPGPLSGVVPHPARAPAPAPSAPLAFNTSTGQVVDDQSIASAQKHARWAVSALNFDDVNTAIKELRNSLRYLGAD